MSRKKSPEGEDIRPTEHDGADEDEHNGQRQSDDDLGVDDRNLGHGLDHRSGLLFGIEDANRAAGA